MTTATVIFTLFVVILSLSACVAIAVISRQASTDAIRINAQLIDATLRKLGEQQSSLLDRFQAIKWEDLAAMRTLEDTDEFGGQTLPTYGTEEETEIEQHRPSPWGALRMEPPADDADLLREDFPEERQVN